MAREQAHLWELGENCWGRSGEASEKNGERKIEVTFPHLILDGLCKSFPLTRTSEPARRLGLSSIKGYATYNRPPLLDYLSGTEVSLPFRSSGTILHQGEFRFLLAFSTPFYQTDIITKWNDLTTSEPTLRLSRSLSSLNPWFSVLTCSKSPSVFRSFAFRLSLSLVTAWSSYKITIETTFVMDMLTCKKMPRLVLTLVWKS